MTPTPTSPHTLHLLLTGPDPAAGSSRLEAILQVGATPTPADPAAQDTTRGPHDPVSGIALTLAIPGATFALGDLADVTGRIAKRRKAQAAIDEAKRLRAEGLATIQLIDPDGRHHLLDTLTPDALLQRSVAV